MHKKNRFDIWLWGQYTPYNSLPYKLRNVLITSLKTRFFTKSALVNEILKLKKHRFRLPSARNRANFPFLIFNKSLTNTVFHEIRLES
jgi:hypothetical protein